ncbi:uncharacterized protein LOC129217313 isoform X2 [Uloborus diversus]|uniref:uncharacterized protein LOC129217313 isoform X2 n=1 Tax=Uloborus diversus TaxID=327109 RepID=UPI0024090CC6|nr:uncharacterized protein LOC129217313 isoform X2 [Uloborus diversus]
MKLVVIFASLLASSTSSCDLNEIRKCWSDFWPLMFDFQEQDQDEICKNLEDGVKCLRSSTVACVEDNSVEAEVLNELDELVNYACTEDSEVEDSEALSDTEDEDEEDDECLTENSDYIFGCLAEGKRKVLTLLMQNGRNANGKDLKCTMYSILADCFVERVQEKCGEEAGKAAREEMDDVPEDIKDACENADIDLYTVLHIR